MKPSPELLEWLAGERERIGTAALAAALDIPQPSLRRTLSTGQLGRLGARVEALQAEREREEDEENEREETEAAVELQETHGIEVDEDELDELAELWGVSPDEVEDLLEVLDIDFETMSLPEVATYIDSLYEALEEQGWDGELSDLWDLYYGYTPGASSS